MRIISKFHDFYDVGMGLGMDDDLVFIRTETNIKNNPCRHYNKGSHCINGQVLQEHIIYFCNNWKKKL